MKKPQLVILGAGFGGLGVLQSLGRRALQHYDVTIVDQNNYFVFTPLLHEVATGSLLPHDVVEPVRSLLPKGVSFIQDTCIDIHWDPKTVHLENRSLPYDVLVSSLGSKSFDRGTPGVKDHTYELKTLANAIKMKRRFLDMFEQASRLDTPEERKKLLSFVVIGAGPTGVELMGEMTQLMYRTFQKYYSNVYCWDEVSLHLVNSGKHVLRSYPEKLQKTAQRVLEKRGVIMHNNVYVNEVTKDSVILNNDTNIAAQTTIWAAGVHIPEVVKKENLTHFFGKPVCSGDTLEIEKDVYVIGDMSCQINHDLSKKFMMTAQLAGQQGTYVGKRINNKLVGSQSPSFVFKDKGSLASLGNYHAVASLFGKVNFSGIIAWFFWRNVYIFKFPSWRKRFRIMFDWFINMFTPRDITRI